MDGMKDFKNWFPDVFLIHEKSMVSSDEDQEYKETDEEDDEDEENEDDEDDEDDLEERFFGKHTHMIKDCY